MTADDLLVLSLNQIGYTKSENPKGIDYYLGILNGCLTECFNIEEAYRRLNGLDMLGDVQFVTNLEDELEYSNFVLINIVSKGVSSRLAGEDNNQMLADYYATMYETAKVRPIMTKYVDTENILQGGEW